VAKCEKPDHNVKKTRPKQQGSTITAGTRRGRGTSHVKQMAIDIASMSGKLPHEILLDIARGEPIVHKVWVSKRDKKGNVIRDEDGHEIQELVERIHYADFAMRVDAAKAAAPFYAPRLAAQQVNLGNLDPKDIVTTMAKLAERLPV